MAKTSVIVLNWNGRKLLEQFMPSVLKYSISDSCDVIIADNYSTDNSLIYLKDEYPNVPVIAFDKNYGFAEGYNKAISKVDSEYVVLLNSDIEVTENWVSTLTDYLDSHPETVAVQPKIKSFKNRSKFEYAGASGGFIDRFGYPFCRGRILDTVETDNGQYNTVIPVFWATGACLCIRRESYLEVGGLDESFFAHMEEIDMCWRLNARGHKIECIPSSVVYHVGGASLQKENPFKTYLNFRNNLLMIYKNSSAASLGYILAVRLILDLMACLHQLIKGNVKNSYSILKAQLDFYRIKSKYKKKRAENIMNSIVSDVNVQFNGSILWQYYFKQKRYFSSLLK